MEILISVITSSLNQERIDTINSTWNTYKNSNIETLFISDVEDLNSKIIKLSNNNDYKSAEEKVVNLLKYIKTNNNKNWYFIVDDDTFIHINNFIEYINHADPNFVHGYLAHKDWWNGLEYIQGGAGTLISNQIIEKIHLNSIVNYNTGFCDVTLGLIFKLNNIPVHGCRQSDDCLFLANSFEKYKNIGLKKLSKKITFHEVRTYHDMKQIMEFYRDVA